MQLVSWNLWQIRISCQFSTSTWTGKARQITTGTGNAASGAASFAYLSSDPRKPGEFQGIVTGAKSAWKASGYNYPGQTELLAQQSGVNDLECYSWRDRPTLAGHRTLLATTHILRRVADTLTLAAGY